MNSYVGTYLVIKSENPACLLIEKSKLKYLRCYYALFYVWHNTVGLV